MAETSVDSTTEAPPPQVIDPANLDIADFIVKSKHLDDRTKTSVGLYHGDDMVTFDVTTTAAAHLGVDLGLLVLTLTVTKTKNGRVVSSYKWDMLPGSPFTITNNEGSSGEPDINWQISASVTVKPEANRTVGFTAQTVTVGGQVDDAPAKPAADFPWWLLGVGLTAAVVIVILLWLWKSGKPGAPAAPASPAAPAAPAAAPAVMVVKT